MAAALAARGVHACVVRLPVVHGQGDSPHNFLPILIRIAIEKGVSAYIGEGRNRWPAVHRLDAARVYRLAIEHATIGLRYHAVSEEGVPVKDIAQLIGHRPNLPVISISADQAVDHFGGFALFAGMDVPASSERTRALLGWQPTQPGVLADINQYSYFETIMREGK